MRVKVKEKEATRLAGGQAQPGLPAGPPTVREERRESTGRSAVRSRARRRTGGAAPPSRRARRVVLGLPRPPINQSAAANPDAPQSARRDGVRGARAAQHGVPLAQHIDNDPPHRRPRPWSPPTAESAAGLAVAFEGRKGGRGRSAQPLPLVRLPTHGLIGSRTSPTQQGRPPRPTPLSMGQRRWGGLGRGSRVTTPPQPRPHPPSPPPPHTRTAREKGGGKGGRGSGGGGGVGIGGGEGKGRGGRKCRGSSVLERLIVFDIVYILVRPGSGGGTPGSGWAWGLQMSIRLAQHHIVPVYLRLHWSTDPFRTKRRSVSVGIQGHIRYLSQYLRRFPAYQIHARASAAHYIIFAAPAD